MIKLQASNPKHQTWQGFTLVEILVIVAILTILSGLTVPTFRFFQRDLDLNNSAEEIINILRVAQNKTLASEGASQWGVYFSTSTGPHQFILFKGTDFASRESGFDEVRELPKSIEIYAINLTGGAPEVIFDRITGGTAQFGDLSMRIKTDFAKIKTVYVQNSGQVELSPAEIVSEENLIKDSRHVHFDYDRHIDVSGEKLILTFEGGTTQDIIINDNIKDGQIYWEGEINVEGENQKIKIHTHELNDPGSLFSIHRDRRYNNKNLTITISGDESGFLIDYSADGLTVTSISIYVTNLQWQ